MYVGKCLCGEISIRIKGSISDIIHCHCSLCRKNSGTAYATNGFINSADFEILTGAKNLTSFSFKPGRNRHFCSECGSPVFSSNEEDPNRLRIRLGILDSDITERPISHNFVTSKANWEELDANLPKYENFEPNRK
ncbi:GFA family protein [Shewanella sp. D64]|uniref:GFA family protein n=1 Tax=unclassified Shewanella TaxID=196818 RepID=UPI0022BA6396|nr:MULTISPECIES: GFA family protein [unclassified Shewanella]MEC4724966.1 GFA family protein [Shewanella sp. D64]MEC4736867.1 GFA family protein [Shewanella sp. E94]WBJ96465.1 GFA family protein [Shewanella sp. MTB7]